jgi:UDP-galactopyranose mutase
VPVAFCGRLANYQYINQDEAILQGLRTADELLGSR